ncbi:phospholipid-translocating ATPase [Cryptococcus wingfieldii CBS 7118]|uniref:Phospholipid-transporting ATPase n=1 Tax=Cryptococcus wingfieldii CBS 7118 TaxID=1295528 RepID=A0A1E3I7I1_9TREE|nr:phospholipid-translocating ATPase [Cryptococcus wingfieldii CBS 7118]ODN83796.1 phospholipid-translocating ATPase [Cryptococcus wingfieldii CBS 7118]
MADYTPLDANGVPLRTLSQRATPSSAMPRLPVDPPETTTPSSKMSRNNKKKKRVSDLQGGREEEEALLGGSGLGGEAAEEDHSKPRISPKSKGRIVPLQPTSSKSSYPANVVRNQKYSIITFVPIVFYEQFKFFFNFYFLVVALSQFIPALKIGYIVTYVAPLAFVLAVTMGKEAYDDYLRFKRDQEANSTRYLVLLPQPPTPEPNQFTLEDETPNHRHLPRPQTRSTPASSIKVGDMVLLEKNQRVPADMVLLTTSEEEGTCFIRTDQLDGETDWKLKVAVGDTQKMGEAFVGSAEGFLYADPPIKDIHTFYGVLTLRSMGPGEVDEAEIPLSVENVLWANTVLAAGSAVGVVTYTGKETRAVMNTSEAGTKMGTLEKEVNRMAKILCTVTFALSLFLVALNGFRGQWYIYVFRFLILFSSIIPISLRVNLDMGKTVYAHQIHTDKEIEGTVVRTGTLPEELGRVEYLLSDKTGTLTRNEMELKKLHMGTLVFGFDSMDEVAHLLIAGLDEASGSHGRQGSLPSAGIRGRRDMTGRVRDAVMALATCHNVTPVLNDDGTTIYQASSPDEVAIVEWTQSVGLTLTHRDRTSMTLSTPSGQTFKFSILAIFPFTSESKRMGIIVRDEQTQGYLFVQKGADVVMREIVQKNDWLDEECGNMAREGLRTLVLGRKKLSGKGYAAFDEAYKAALLVPGEGRAVQMAKVIATHLESDVELLALTGVEDKLQEDVKPTLELLRNAGLKIWMLTGDKIETATNIAVSSKLVARGQYIHQVAKLRTADEVRDMLDFLQTKLDCCLVIDGESLQLCLDRFRTEFIVLATRLPIVVACRCSPTQKADVAFLIREYTKKTVCCIGDGGNDVSMIQAADVGVGIVGKEGKQASLAADFSINQFSHLTKLLLWHGRNSYKRSAKLSQFVIHRGLIIAVIQAVFSSIFFFAPIALYQGWLQVGYATLYTMAPVFSLVLDRDVNEDLALLYPELYKELTKGRSLSYKTFFTWLTISVYQGGIIMLLSLLLFESEFLHIVAISFTALVINELIMVALEVTTWHSYMVLSEVGTGAVYFGSMAFLPEYFDMGFVLSKTFAVKVVIIVAVSSFPLYVIKAAHQRLNPAAYKKVAGL